MIQPEISVAGYSINKCFPEGDGQRNVLSDLSFALGHGEVIALLGQSGSGKSTLLNIICGIELPDSGRIELAGTTISQLPEPQRSHIRRRQFGFVFQFFNLIPTLTVKENLHLPLTLNGLNDSASVDLADQLLESVGLANRADSFPDRLSGGEQQRIAIARALVHRPAVLLADEPTGNLDSTTGERTLELLLTLCQKRRTSAILVTHSNAVATRADRILRLDAGRLVPEDH